MTWEVRLSKEVRKWHSKLGPKDRGIANSKFAELAEQGNELAHAQVQIPGP